MAKGSRVHTGPPPLGLPESSSTSFVPPSTSHLEMPAAIFNLTAWKFPKGIWWLSNILKLPKPLRGSRAIIVKSNLKKWLILGLGRPSDYALVSSVDTHTLVLHVLDPEVLCMGYFWATYGEWQANHEVQAFSPVTLVTCQTREPSAVAGEKGLSCAL